MDNPRAADERAVDYNNNQILPGVSESQDTMNRTISPDIDDNPGKGINTPFIQPTSLSNNAQFRKRKGSTK
jgi:hypothetical protein